MLNCLNISATTQLKNDQEHIALFNSKTHSSVTALTFFLNGEDTNSSHGKPFCCPLGTLKKGTYIHIYEIFKFSSHYCYGHRVMEMTQCSLIKGTKILEQATPLTFR
jgi:hypothetical protein